jgi:hypothetical protein
MIRLIHGTQDYLAVLVFSFFRDCPPFGLSLSLPLVSTSFYALNDASYIDTHFYLENFLLLGYRANRCYVDVYA